MAEKLKVLFLCKKKSRRRQEMSERVGEIVLPVKMLLLGVDIDSSIHVHSNWKFQLVISNFPLLSLSLPKADRPLKPLKREIGLRFSVALKVKLTLN